MLRLQAWDILCEILFADGHKDLEQLVQPMSGNYRLQLELVGLANAYFVTAALWKALCKRDLVCHLSGEIRDYLASFYELSVDRNKTVRDQLIECIGALNRNGIVPMPIKGAAHLMGGIYSDPAERFVSDIDLLIPISKIREASLVFAELGYFEAPIIRDYSRHHHLPVLVRTLEDVAVEVHTAPVFAHAQSGLNVDAMWENAARTSCESLEWRLASSSDSAMLAFLHGEVVDECLARFILDLRGYLDLHQIVRHAGTDIDWNLNLRRAEACGASKLFRRYLNMFEQLTGQSVLTEVRSNGRDRAHYFVCRRAIMWPAIQKTATRLAATRIRERYSIGDNPFVMNAYRLRQIGETICNQMTRRWRHRSEPGNVSTVAVTVQPSEENPRRNAEQE